MDFLNKKSVPDVELSDEDLDALGSLSKKNVKGMEFNPYTKIDPKYLTLGGLEDEDDDEWFYATVSTYGFSYIFHLLNILTSL